MRPKSKKRDAAFFVMRAGKRDSNHGTIRDGLRRSGYDVIDTAALPKRADLLVHIGSDRYVWLEVKTATGTLTADERKFRDKCERIGARWALVRTLPEALDVLVRAGGKGLAPRGRSTPLTVERLASLDPRPMHGRITVTNPAPVDFRGETLEQRIRRMAKPSMTMARR